MNALEAGKGAQPGARHCCPTYGGLHRGLGSLKEYSADRGQMGTGHEKLALLPRERRPDPKERCSLVIQHRAAGGTGWPCSPRLWGAAAWGSCPACEAGQIFSPPKNTLPPPTHCPGQKRRALGRTCPRPRLQASPQTPSHKQVTPVRMQRMVPLGRGDRQPTTQQTPPEHVHHPHPSFRSRNWDTR